MFRDFKFILRNSLKHHQLSLAVVSTLMLGIRSGFAYLDAIIFRKESLLCEVNEFARARSLRNCQAR